MIEEANGLLLVSVRNALLLLVPIVLSSFIGGLNPQQFENTTPFRAFVLMMVFILLFACNGVARGFIEKRESLIVWSIAALCLIFAIVLVLIFSMNIAAIVARGEQAWLAIGGAVVIGCGLFYTSTEFGGIVKEAVELWLDAR